MTILPMRTMYRKDEASRKHDTQLACVAALTRRMEPSWVVKRTLSQCQGDCKAEDRERDHLWILHVPLSTLALTCLWLGVGLESQVQIILQVRDSCRKDLFPQGS